ncbi:UDP-glucuronosyl/UDP-glucosyltransferase [Trema orientale]|uniref:UDP-glucuronosyl/UDP-glucosyltransferase n=1 Tax=Trema orientale TaxID=63057 RepID=A0A2P5FVD4_TREOI|nr:UDP-glucuronosyl/UDP-glucosyltransferase [Trema orientale]
MGDTHTIDHTPNPHDIIFPLCYQGHVTPTIHLAIKLASKGSTITFVNTQVVHHNITKSQSVKGGDDIFAEARKSGLDICYKTVSDGFPLGFDRMVNHDQYLKGNFHVFPAHVDELVASLVRSDPPISCLIVDTLSPWISKVAKKHNLISVSFWTQPALVFSLDYHLDLLKTNGHFASQDGNRQDAIDYIPGVKSIEPKDLMSYLQQTDVSMPTHRLIYKSFEDVKNVDFILCNTIEELEYDIISAINDRQPIYSFGPLVLSPSGLTRSLVPTSLRPKCDCSQWLNTKPNHSVLYVSLGSLILSNRVDIEEIAYGLLLSKVNFIWILRPDAISYDESYVLPIGFENEINDNGLMVPWCHQIEVISHPAVGGSLTHCGWNSVLESLRCGVPMICFPLLIDQGTNRKLVVDDWRCGVNLCDKKPLTRVEVAEKIDRLMRGKAGQDLRKETLKMRETLESALATDGSSEKSLSQFITNVKVKISERSRQ